MDDHVKAAGGHLRMWNDGLMNTNVVQLNNDIVVEFWYVNGETATQLVNRGAQVMNAKKRLCGQQYTPRTGSGSGVADG